MPICQLIEAIALEEKIFQGFALIDKLQVQLRTGKVEACGSFDIGNILIVGGSSKL